MNRLKWHGFTLIEILAVVAIIGILTGISLGPIKAARLRARDSKRKADINAIAQGLDLYYAEKHSYPNDLSSGCVTYKSDSGSNNWSTFATLLQPYMPASSGVPVDPINNSTYRYVFQSSGCNQVAHKLTVSAVLENQNDLDGILDPSNTFRVYTIYR